MIRRGEVYSQDPSGSGGGSDVSVVESPEIKNNKSQELLNVPEGRLEGEMENGIFVAYSGTGLVRKRNEDSCAVTQNAMIVCDGVGGVKYGGEASRVTTRTLAKQLSSGKELSPFILHPFVSRALDAEKKKIEQKNVKHGIVEPKNLLGELETTVAAVEIKGDELRSMVAGDSRVYIYSKDGDLKCISMDTSFIQRSLLDSVDDYHGKYPKATPDSLARYINELERTSPSKNIIEDSLGPSGTNNGPTIQNRLLYKVRDIQNQLTDEGRIIDYKDEDVMDRVRLAEGDVVMICSDGLNDMVANNAISTTVKGNLDNIGAMRESLLQACLKNGARDNVTMVIYKHGKKTQ